VKLSRVWTLRLWTSRPYTVLPGTSVSFLVGTCCLYRQVRKPVLNTETAHHSETLIHIYQTTRRHISLDRKLICKFRFFFICGERANQVGRHKMAKNKFVKWLKCVYWSCHALLYPKGGVTKTSAWILFREVLAVLVRKYTLCEQRAELLNVKPVGIYSDYWAISVTAFTLRFAAVGTSRR